MKNKKGFTLVELMAVVTIIGVLILFAFPTIEKLTKENKEKVYQQQLNNIILSLKSWASDNRIYLPEDENENLTITLGNLKSEGYIEYEVKNPLTGNCFDNSMALIITKVKKNYDYSIDLDTIKEVNKCEIVLDTPIIALNGDMVENIEVNSIYVDKGVIAKDKDGNNIADNVAITISGSGNAIDTSKIGNQYIITYSVTANGIMVEVSRTVKIVDTMAPNLIIPDDVVIDTTVTTIDIMEGVSATDNSDEAIEISTKHNIKFGTVGKYTITYTAEDSSRNKSVKKREVIIQKVINEIMSSDNDCIKNVGSICPNGTLVSVQVNATRTYNFYVIKDTGTKLTLIMESNLGNKVAWVSSGDYNDNTNFGTLGNSNKGPITALNYLNSQTSEWTNIQPIANYTYLNNLNGTTNTYGYQKLEIKNGIGRLMSQDGNTITNTTGTSRARLLTSEELTTLQTENSNTMPTYLYMILSSSNTEKEPGGYWLLTASTSYSYSANLMQYNGYPISDAVNGVTMSGVRPVIELSK